MKMTKEYIFETLKFEVDNGVSIWIYGAGGNAIVTIRKLRKQKCRIAGGFVDDCFYKPNSEVEGLKVSAFSNVIQIIEKNDIVCVSVDDCDSAYAMMERLPSNIKCIHMLYHHDVYQGKPDLDFNYYTEHYKDFQEVYDSLMDQKSRNTMEGFLRSCVSGDIRYVKEYGEENAYFNELSDDLHIKTIVDCGAYDGDTIIRGIDYYGENAIQRIHAFEPDEESVKKLISNINLKGIDKRKINIIKKGAWSKKDILRFCSMGDGSNINESGDAQIEVDSIDNCIEGNVDFIKMDIEGSGQQAVIGGQKIICQNLPMLAICVYHKREDLFTIKRTIDRIAPNQYVFYLRHHAKNLFGLVLYAVPRKKRM